MIEFLASVHDLTNLIYIKVCRLSFVYTSIIEKRQLQIEGKK